MIFYPGPELRITHEVFEVTSPFYQRYPIAELEQVHLARAKRSDNRSWHLGRAHALRAVYRGQVVDLFQTHDRVIIGQVYRALRRALERLEDTRQIGPRNFHPVA